MASRRNVLTVAALVAGSLAAASPASAADPQVTLTLSHRLVVNYVEDCRPEVEARWHGEGSGVAKVVMTLTQPSGDFYRETAEPGELHIMGGGCASVDDFGKWTIRVVAYNRAGDALATRSASYYHKGNTQIKDFNAAPEPVRKGGTITVSGRLLRVKFGSAPWYVAYAGKPIRVYFKPTNSSTWTYMGATTTAQDGRFRKGFTARQDGAWRVRFPGTSRYHVETSRNDYVDVR